MMERNNTETVEAADQIEKPEVKKKHHHVRTGVKAGLITLGSLIVIILLIFFFISPIAKYMVEKHSKEWIGRQIWINKLDINIFKGTVVTDGFRLLEKDDKTNFVSFDTLSVAINPMKLLSHEINVRYITLDKPRIRIVQDDSIFNFTDIIKRFSKKDTTKDEDKNAKPWDVGVYNIKLKDGQLSYKDVVRDTKWDLKNLKLNVPGVYFSGKKSTDAGVSFHLAEGGDITTKVKYNMKKNIYGVDVNITELALANLLPYMSDMVNIHVLNGVFSGHVNVDGNVDDPSNVTIKGNMGVKGFYAEDNSGKRLAAVNNLAVEVGKVNPKEGVCDINSVKIDKLSSAFEMYKDHNNFSYLMKPEKPKTTGQKKEEAEASKKSKNKPMHVVVKHFELNHSDFSFSDYTIRMPFSYHLTDINVKSENFSPDNSSNSMMLRTQVPGGGFIFLKWTGSMSSIVNQRIELMMKNVSLTQFTPYSMEYFAYPIKSGVFSFTSENIIRNYQLNGKNKIDIYDCKVGDKNKSLKPEFNVPLKLALYIIKDKDDRILLDVPVSGNVNSPQFSYRKLIFKTIVNLLVKVAVSPFRFLANTFGFQSDKLSSVEMDPMLADITSEQFETFTKLADLAKKKPDITLDLTQQFEWQKTLEDRSLYNLKQRYYLVIHPEKRGQRLAPVDMQDIRDMDEKIPGLVAFADSLSKSGSNVKEKAIAIYPPDIMAAQLNQLIGMRNHFVSGYFVGKMGLPAGRVKVHGMAPAQLKGYSGKSQYKVDLTVGGESYTPAEAKKK